MSHCQSTILGVTLPPHQKDTSQSQHYFRWHENCWGRWQGRCSLQCPNRDADAIRAGSIVHQGAFGRLKHALPITVSQGANGVRVCIYLYLTAQFLSQIANGIRQTFFVFVLFCLQDPSLPMSLYLAVAACFPCACLIAVQHSALEALLWGVVCLALSLASASLWDGFNRAKFARDCMHAKTGTSLTWLTTTHKRIFTRRWKDGNCEGFLKL